MFYSGSVWWVGLRSVVDIVVNKFNWTNINRLRREFCGNARVDIAAFCGEFCMLVFFERYSIL